MIDDLKTKIVFCDGANNEIANVKSRVFKINVLFRPSIKIRMVDIPIPTI
jgi:hypothetical protein